MNTTEHFAQRGYTMALEGAIMGIADTESDLGTISGYTVHIVRMIAERAQNAYIKSEAVAWLNENADEIAMIDEKGGEA